jgi:hydroxypyruvate isomerase
MTRFAANIDFLFQETAKLERLGRAAAAGFQGVEVGHVIEDQLSAVRAAAVNSGIEVVLVSLGPGDLMTGGPGYMGIPRQRHLVELEMRRALRSADTLRCRRIALPPSRIPQELERTACLAALIENVAHAAEMASHQKVDLLIEPLNKIDWPGLLIGSTEDALHVLRAVGRNNVGLQLDLYHVAMQGESLLESIRTAAPYLRHVQFADVPGRHEPGTGTLPLRQAFRLLKQLEYSGWVGAEYVPSRFTEQTLSWLGVDAAG